MSLNVDFSDDPAWVYEQSRPFLITKPVIHNLILTLLQSRISSNEEGRYWLARKSDTVVGVILQSPLTYFANVTPLTNDAVDALVGRMVADGISLPGVNGEAATTARFAGKWTEQCNSGAHPSLGLRIYELVHLCKPAGVPGSLRQATAADRDIVIKGMQGFYDDLGESVNELERVVDGRLAAGQFWLWECGEPVSLTACTEPVANVVRIQAAYTFPAQRNRGFAKACVAGLSEIIQKRAQRCMLYTDLANSISNAVFRHIGYRCVAEALRYQFK